MAGAEAKEEGGFGVLPLTVLLLAVSVAIVVGRNRSPAPGYLV